MDIPQPDGPDVNRGTGVVITCWVLITLVAALLVFRVAVKALVVAALSPAARPTHLWGLEDLFLWMGFIVDVVHQALIWKRSHSRIGSQDRELMLSSYQHGLGRHYFFLTPEERRLAMKWDWIAAQLAVVAVSLYRTGVMCFLYVCFAKSRRRVAITLLVAIALHTAVNLVTILQAVMQCGPNPYRPANRAAYYRYLWDPLPEDGSVVCQSPTVQASIGYAQGAFNTALDFMLVGLAALEIWQFLFQAHARHLTSIIGKIKALEPHVRRQRVWQTVLVCLPLSLSGIACIVKSPLVGAIGERMDITWNIIPLVLWVKIENSTIPIAATATVLRLFLKVFVNKEKTRAPYAYSSDRYGHSGAQGVELDSGLRSGWNATGDHPGTRGKDDYSDGAGGRSLHGSETELVDDSIHIKVEYEVRVVEDGTQVRSAHGRSSVQGVRKI